MPEGPLGGRGDGDQVPYARRVHRLLGVVPLVVRGVRHEALDLAGLRPVHRVVRLPPRIALHAAAGADLPVARGAVGDPGADAGEPAVRPGTDLADLVGVGQIDPAAVLRAARAPRVEPGPAHVHAPLGAVARRAEAEAPVDRVLGGDQGGDRVAPLLRGGQVLGHHPAEQSAPAVRRGDGDLGDRVGGETAAADRADLLPEGPEGRDDPVPVEGPGGPREVDVRQPVGDLRVGHDRRAEEAGAQGTLPVGELGLRHRAYVDSHPSTLRTAPARPHASFPGRPPPLTPAGRRPAPRPPGSGGRSRRCSRRRSAGGAAGDGRSAARTRRAAPSPRAAPRPCGP